MTLLVAFVTADAAVVETVADRKVALLPNELRAGGFSALGGREPVVTAFDTRKGGGIDDFLVWLNWDTASSVVILTDDTIPNLVEKLGDEFSVHRFTPPLYGCKVANQLTSLLARYLRALRFLATRFEDLKYQQILRLPLRNFDAAEIVRMREVCRDMTSHENYGREIDALLRDMRRRQRPKKASSRDEVYLVDESERHFRLGNELHAHADTSMPPHNKLCVISNYFRFGLWFDGSTHYNVSLDAGRMTGKYPDCHDVSRKGGKGSHLNMFSNDFF